MTPDDERRGLSRTEQMRRIRGRDTRPELLLRRALWAAGHRYRVNWRTSAGRADVAFPGRRVAVFIDGCFWHGCPEHYVRPRTRGEFWASKLRENVERDRRQTLDLELDHWTVVRVWEHEVFEELGAAVERIVSAKEGGRVEGPKPDWRVARVVPLDEAGRVERREMEDLRDPASTRAVSGPRTTKKWKRPRTT